MYTFSFFPHTNPKWLLAVTSLPAPKFNFIKSGENNSSTISTPSFWSDLETILKRTKFLIFRTQIFKKVHMKKVTREAR